MIGEDDVLDKDIISRIYYIFKYYIVMCKY